MVVTPEQMRTLERLTDEAGVSYGEMMERAGRGLADFIRSYAPDSRRVVLLAGTGNNGGDCYVAAYYLALAGWDAKVIAPFGEPATEISRNAAKRAAELGIPVFSEPEDLLWMTDVIVDGLFGTGFHGELPDGAKSALAVPSGTILIACDVPSGGNALTGGVSKGTAFADATVTFGAVKLGMTQYPLREHCGEIHLVDIGISAETEERLLMEPEIPVHVPTLETALAWLPELQPDAHKNQRGHLLTVAGSIRMRGACVLAATAAMRSGAGLQTVASAEPALQAVCARTPECMCLPLQTDAEGFFLNEENHALLKTALAEKDALLIGCGMGVTENTRNLTKFLLQESKCPVIIDADGLNVLQDCIECIPRGRTILTPHPAEAARLLGMTTAQVQEDRPAAAWLLAERTGAVVVLKGAGTIIADTDPTIRSMYVCTYGNPGMARAGSGDVLAGIIASLTAQGMLYDAAAAAGAVLHACAGDAAAKRLSEHCMLPQDIIASLQEVMHKCTGK